MNEIVLAVGDVPVVRRHRGADLPREHSPRPYLGVRTLAGVPVTEERAADHAHHYGLSAALPDIDGFSTWGGRTYVRGVGSTMLDNHAVQRAHATSVTGDSVLEESLSWISPEGAVLLDEQRDIAVAAMPEDAAAWALRWRSRLVSGTGFSLGSPQTNGRAGAFYGGLFWRTPFRRVDVFTADGDGVDLAHGSQSPWLALATAEASLVAWTRPGFPWFVRAEDFVYFCPAVAVSERRVVAPCETLTLELRVAVVDGRVDRARAERLAAALAEEAS